MSSDQISSDELFPALDAEHFDLPDHGKLAGRVPSTHPPRILLLYGSLRERSYSRLLVEEAARLLTRMGAETRIFDPRGLPMPDSVPADHPKVQELRALSAWSEGQVWCSPERHGAITGVFKSQIDWIPLEVGSVRPTQGAHARGDAGQRRLAILQRRERPACARPLDAHGHHPEPVLGGEGVPGIRRDRADEALALLRPGGGRHGGTHQVHAADARPRPLPHEPL